MFLLLPLLSKGQHFNLMPWPQSLEVSDGRFNLSKEFNIALYGTVSDRLEKGASRWLRRLDGRTGLFFDQEFISFKDSTSGAALVITINRMGDLRSGEDESYQLSITNNGIHIQAETDFGALHGLETLIQLLHADQNGYFFPAVNINDSPRFPWRGLMIDVARHFQPLDAIKRNIDAMAVVKMNVLHLHLSDDHGFRVESKVYPKLHELASDGLYFSQVQVKELVRYAAERGIRVYPEFDVPGHTTSILTAYPHLGSAPGPYKLQKHAGIFDPTLNPTIEETYTFLHNLFTEMAGLFPDEYFHIGGDENEGRHWNSNSDIQAFMKQHNIRDNHELQGYFTNRVLKSLTQLDKKMVGWDEILHPGLPQTAVIHSWRGREYMFKAAKEGYSTVLSKGYYIDLMKPASEHYLNDPLPPDHGLSEEEANRILGGEATMWSELVTPLTLDSRVWPKTAAIAERLWSPVHVDDIENMYDRLEHISLRLEEAGSAHIRNQSMIMRNLTAGQPTEALKTLIDVVEPMKGYTRNPEGLMYTMYSPYTLFADAATSDAPVARKFNTLVNQYLIQPDDDNLKHILSHLELWKGNHQRLMPVIETSPVLREIENLSLNLSRLAERTLDAINHNYDKDPVRQLEWYKESQQLIGKAREQGGRTELQVVNSMEKLFKRHIAHIEARYAAEKINVDGDLSEWKRSSWDHFISHRKRNQRDTCFYTLKWDEKNLYMAFRVQSPDPPRQDGFEPKGSSPANGIWLLIDRNPDGKMSGKGQKVAYHISFFNEVKEKDPPADLRKAAQVKSVWIPGVVKSYPDKGQGYQIEVAIEWNDLGDTPEKYDLIGMDFCVDDQKNDCNGSNDLKLRKLRYSQGFSQLVLLD